MFLTGRLVFLILVQAMSKWKKMMKIIKDKPQNRKIFKQKLISSQSQHISFNNYAHSFLNKFKKTTNTNNLLFKICLTMSRTTRPLFKVSKLIFRIKN
jgi:hypothetical protein